MSGERLGNRKGENGLDIALMNEKVTFQKNTVVTDSIGNHRNRWEDDYTCHATIGGEGMAGSREKEAAGTTVEDSDMTVTVRYCRRAAAIGTAMHRVIFHGEIYDIVCLDHMNFRKKCLKFICRKARR